MAASKGIPIPYLRAWREWRAWEQEELGNLAKVTPTTISRLEHGAPARIGTIAKLATALGIERETLLHKQPGQKTVAA